MQSEFKETGMDFTEGQSSSWEKDPSLATLS